MSQHDWFKERFCLDSVGVICWTRMNWQFTAEVFQTGIDNTVHFCTFLNSQACNHKRILSLEVWLCGGLTQTEKSNLGFRSYKFVSFSDRVSPFVLCWNFPVENFEWILTSILKVIMPHVLPFMVHFTWSCIYETWNWHQTTVHWWMWRRKRTK